MKKCLLLLLMGWFGMVPPGWAQSRYYTQNGHISFFSKAPIEDIEAHNQKAVSFIDFSTGDMVFSVPMKGFQFRKSLMETHFNENYVESDKFPKATFKGKITNISTLDLKTDRTYPARIQGELTIHGVTRVIQTEGTLQVQGPKVIGRSVFTVAPEDYNIEIPFLVREHIAKSIEITVDLQYEPYTKNSL